MASSATQPSRPVGRAAVVDLPLADQRALHTSRTDGTGHQAAQLVPRGVPVVRVRSSLAMPRIPPAARARRRSCAWVKSSTETIAGCAGWRGRTTRSGLARRNRTTCPAAMSSGSSSMSCLVHRPRKRVIGVARVLQDRAHCAALPAAAAVGRQTTSSRNSFSCPLKDVQLTHSELVALALRVTQLAK